MLYIEDDMLSPGNLSPAFFDLGKGHKSDGDGESPPSASQVKIVLMLSIFYNSQFRSLTEFH